MPTGPSKPTFPPTTMAAAPPPKPRSVAMESEKAAISRSASRRKGYASTVMTQGVSLGEAQTKKQKAERLGIPGA